MCVCGFVCVCLCAYYYISVLVYLRCHFGLFVQEECMAISQPLGSCVHHRCATLITVLCVSLSQNVRAHYMQDNGMCCEAPCLETSGFLIKTLTSVK